MPYYGTRFQLCGEDYEKKKNCGRVYLNFIFIMVVNGMAVLTTIFKMSDNDIMKAIKENGYCIDRVEKTHERCFVVVKQNG